MAKNIIILGAGASAQYGAPVMANFMAMARDLRTRRLLERPVIERLDRVDDVLADLQVAHSKSDIDLRNIESILTALELANIIEKLPGVQPCDILSRIDDLKMIIAETLRRTPSGRTSWDAKISATWDLQPKSDRSSPNTFPPSELSDLIRSIAQKNKPEGGHSTAILTFNYDLILEAAISSTTHVGAKIEGYSVDYGLSAPTQENPVLVLKLHGSLNWFEKPNAIELEATPADPIVDGQPLARFDRYSLIGSEVLKKAKAAGFPDTPIIVPPSWNKFAAYEKMRPIWKRAAEELQDAEKISVVGYSMPATDTFFSHLYALGTIGRRQLRSFRVYDVNDSSRERFEKLLGNGARQVFEMIKCDASCAFEDIAARLVNEV